MKGRVGLGLVAIALVGCKTSPSIVGHWTGTSKGVPATMDYKPDGTFRVSLEMRGNTIVFTGDYKVAGDTMTETFRELELPGKPPAIVATVKKTMANEFDKPQVSKLTWASADSVTMSDKDGPIALTRAKP